MIIWLASYPKSGSTFLRSLISSYVYSESGTFDFKLLKNIKQFPTNEFFENLGIDVSNKNQVSKNYINAQIEINKKSRITFLKTHSSFCKMFNRYNFTDLQNTLGVIYIVRDPRNVATSFARHNSKSVKDTVDIMTNSLATGNEANQVETYLGSWNFNYNSWKVFKSSNIYHLLKYEDLIFNTKNSFKQVLNFINNNLKFPISIDDRKVEKVIDETKFSKMRDLEKKVGFDEAKINDNTGKVVPFFNLGPKNNWKKNLDVDLSSKIEEAFREEMIELNYL
tara:strand:- start:1697 stop:2536 length:840 start_codon:yes stop_codon:yes gene_type:complete